MGMQRRSGALNPSYCETAGKRSDFFRQNSYMLAWDSARALALLAGIPVANGKALPW
jgi:hypothetical protein